MSISQGNFSSISSKTKKMNDQNSDENSYDARKKYAAMTSVLLSEMKRLKTMKDQSLEVDEALLGINEHCSSLSTDNEMLKMENKALLDKNEEVFRYFCKATEDSCLVFERMHQISSSLISELDLKYQEMCNKAHLLNEKVTKASLDNEKSSIEKVNRAEVEQEIAVLRTENSSLKESYNLDTDLLRNELELKSKEIRRLQEMVDTSRIKDKLAEQTSIEYQKEIENLVNVNNALSGELESLTKRQSEQISKISLIQKDNNNICIENTDLKNRIIELERINSSMLENSIKNEEKINQMQSNIGDKEFYEQQVQIIKRERNELSLQLEEVKNGANMKIFELEKDIDMERKKINDYEFSIENLKQTNTEQQKLIVNLQDTLKKAEKHEKELINSLIESESRISEIESIKALPNEELSEVNKKLHLTEMERDKIREELRRAQNIIIQNRSIIEEFENERQQNIHRKEQIKSAIDQYNDHINLIEKQNHEVSETLVETTLQKEKLENENMNMQIIIEELHDTNRKLSDQIQNAKISIDNNIGDAILFSKDYNSEIYDYHLIISQLKNEIAELKERNQSLIDEFGQWIENSKSGSTSFEFQAELVNHRININEMEKKHLNEINELRKLNDSLIKELDMTKSSIQALTTKHLDSLNQLNVNMEQKDSYVKNIIKENEILRDQISKMTYNYNLISETKMNIEKSLDDLKGIINEKDLSIKSLIQECEHLNSKVSQANNIYNQNTKEIETLSERIDILNAQNLGLEESLANLSKKRNTNTDNNLVLCSNVSETSINECCDTDHFNPTTEHEGISELEDLLSIANNQLTILSNENSIIKKQLLDAYHSYGPLQGEIFERISLIDNLSNELNESNSWSLEAKNEQTKTIQSLRDQVVYFSGELTLKNNELSQLRHQISSANNCYQTLEIDFAASKKELSQRMKEIESLNKLLENKENSVAIELNVLHEENSCLRQSLLTLQKENQTMLVKYLQHQNDTNDTLKLTINDIGVINSELFDTHFYNQIENDSFNEDIVSMSTRISSYEQEIKTLGEHLHNSQEDTIKCQNIINDMYSQIHELNKINNDLKNKLKTSELSSIEALSLKEKMIEIQEFELQHLNQISLLKENYDHLISIEKEKNASLEVSLEGYKLKMDAINLRIEESEHNESKSIKQLKIIETELLQLKDMKNELEESVQSLISDKDDLIKEINHFKQKISSMYESKGNENLLNEIEHLKRDIDTQKSTYENEIALMKKDLEDSILGLSIMKEENRKLHEISQIGSSTWKSNYEKLKEEYEQIRAAFILKDEYIMKIESESSKLKKDIISVKEMNEHLLRQSIDVKSSSSNNQTDQLFNDNTKREDIIIDNSVSILEMRIKSLQYENQMLRDSIIQNNERHQVELDTIRNSIAGLHGLADHTKAISELNSSISILQSELLHLQNELDKESNMLIEVRNELSISMTNNAKLRIDVSDSQTKYQCLFQPLSQLLQCNTNADIISRISKMISTSESSNELKSVIRDNQAQIATLRVEPLILKNQITELKLSLENEEKKNKILSIQYMNSQNMKNDTLLLSSLLGVFSKISTSSKEGFILEMINCIKKGIVEGDYSVFESIFSSISLLNKMVQKFAIKISQMANSQQTQMDEFERRFEILSQKMSHVIENPKPKRKRLPSLYERSLKSPSAPKESQNSFSGSNLSKTPNHEKPARFVTYTRTPIQLEKRKNPLVYEGPTLTGFK